jgi:hypothetical protein
VCGVGLGLPPYGHRAPYIPRGSRSLSKSGFHPVNNKNINPKSTKDLHCGGINENQYQEDVRDQDWARPIEEHEEDKVEDWESKD